MMDSDGQAVLSRAVVESTEPDGPVRIPAPPLRDSGQVT